VIVPDAFWPAGELEPVEPFGKWLDETVHALGRSEGVGCPSNFAWSAAVR
jgi:hypothetical protein